jgi:hypothetical protein
LENFHTQVGGRSILSKEDGPSLGILNQVPHSGSPFVPWTGHGDNNEGNLLAMQEMFNVA